MLTLAESFYTSRKTPELLDMTCEKTTRFFGDSSSTFRFIHASDHRPLAIRVESRGQVKHFSSLFTSPQTYQNHHQCVNCQLLFTNLSGH